MFCNLRHCKSFWLEAKCQETIVFGLVNECLGDGLECGGRNSADWNYEEVWEKQVEPEYAFENADDYTATVYHEIVFNEVKQ